MSIMTAEQFIKFINDPDKARKFANEVLDLLKPEKAIKKVKQEVKKPPVKDTQKDEE